MPQSIQTNFKHKFIVLYHLNSSLNKLQNRFYKSGILTDHTKKFLQEVLNDKNLKELTAQSKLRNILIHYEINGVPSDRLSKDIEMFGLVEYFFDGKTYSEIAEIIELQTIRIVGVLEEWLNWDISQKRLRSWW
jgi:hypothetical protein